MHRQTAITDFFKNPVRHLPYARARNTDLPSEGDRVQHIAIFKLQNGDYKIFCGQTRYIKRILKKHANDDEKFVTNCRHSGNTWDNIKKRLVRMIGMLPTNAGKKFTLQGYTWGEFENELEILLNE